MDDQEIPAFREREGGGEGKRGKLMDTGLPIRLGSQATDLALLPPFLRSSSDYFKIYITLQHRTVQFLYCLQGLTWAGAVQTNVAGNDNLIDCWLAGYVFQYGL